MRRTFPTQGGLIQTPALNGTAAEGMARMYDAAFVERLGALVGSALPVWGLPPETEITLLNLSENATWLLRDPAQDRHMVLRLHRPGYHTEQEIRSELAWVSALRNSGVVDTATPIPGRDGTLLQILHDGDQTRCAVMFQHVTGTEPAPGGNLPAWFRRLGAVTAALHRHARDWDPPPGFARMIWDFETTLGDRPHWGDWRHAVGLDREGHRLLQRASDAAARRLEAFGKTPDRFGLIHADLRLANLLVADDRLSVIDFDDCGHGWFMYDFAAAISFVETDPIVGDLTQSWMEGYRSVAHLSAEAEAMMPTFVILRRILLLAWIASHHETPTAQDHGHPYTAGAVALADAYLTRHG
jgi:Ser/Thr protein kinase RdoA (MazF antagonist)